MVGGVLSSRPARRAAALSPVERGAAFRARRESLGLNRNEFAAVAGVNWDTVRRFEDGDPKLKGATVLSLLAALRRASLGDGPT